MSAAAVTCEFDRQSCSHAALFASEYKRTNRTRGTKILRCFPHCCPTHVSRSYCGSALFVRVEHAHRNVLVCAHFEEADANELCVGDTIAASRVAGSIQTEQTPKGEWIEGALHSSSAASETDVFEINPGARWYYEWGSAATKAQRFTKHVLRVYVFEQALTQSSDSTDGLLRVAAVATSSAFMVVSYRRAADETRADRRLLALLASSAGIPRAALRAPLSAESDSDSAILALEATLLQQHQQRAQSAAARSEEQEPRSHDRVHQRLSSMASASPNYSPSSTSSQRRSGSHDDDSAERMWQDKTLWECAHPETRMQTKHLAILYCFLGAVDAMRFAHCLSHWSATFAHEWRPSSDPPLHQQQQQQQQRFHPYSEHARSPPLLPRAVVAHTRISWSFLMTLAANNESVGHVDERLARLVQRCADVTGWLVFSSDNATRFQQLFADAAPALLDKHALRCAFVEGVRLAYDMIDHFLAASASASVGRGHHQSQQPHTSTQSLVEDIIAAVFQYDELQTIRPAVLTILTATSMHGLAGFVAQVRSHFVRRASDGSSDDDGNGSSSGARLDMALTRVLHVFASPLHGSWVFDGTQTVLDALDVQHAHGISLVNALDWLRECSNVEIDVEDDQRLAIRSLWTISSSRNIAVHGTHLIVDGLARVFSHFPSGLSSMIAIGGRHYGDYQASFTTPDALVIDLYAWSETSSSQVSDARENTVLQWGSATESKAQPTVIHSQLHLSVERFGRPAAAPDAPILHVDVAVELGFTGASSDAVESDTLQKRLDVVHGWKQVYQVSAMYRRAQM